MPAHHLTTAPDPPHAATGIGAAVRAVLSGDDTAAVAAAHTISPADLDDAVAIYHAAGIAALDQAVDGNWFQALIEFTDWKSAETIGAHLLGPRLDSLATDGRISGWWFLRKYPCWRLRLHNADPADVTQTLDDLAEEGTIARWQRTLYEPETAAFGGRTAMDVIHDLFCRDSTGILDYARHPAPAIGRKELSLLLLNGMFQAAHLDQFERGEVFIRTARLRPPPPDDADLTPLANGIRHFLSVPDLSVSPLFSAQGPAAHATAWLTAHTDAGTRLASAARAGHLERGLRALLTHVVIFHWNRIGLSADQQGILAHAAAAALLPPD